MYVCPCVSLSVCQSVLSACLSVCPSTAGSKMFDVSFPVQKAAAVQPDRKLQRFQSLQILQFRSFMLFRNADPRILRLGNWEMLGRDRGGEELSASPLILSLSRLWATNPFSFQSINNISTLASSNSRPNIPQLQSSETRILCNHETSIDPFLWLWFLKCLAGLIISRQRRRVLKRQHTFFEIWQHDLSEWQKMFW